MQLLRPRDTVLALRTLSFVSVADAASRHARKRLKSGRKCAPQACGCCDFGRLGFRAMRDGVLGGGW
jgi:hypothetical protein